MIEMKIIVRGEGGKTIRQLLTEKDVGIRKTGPRVIGIIAKEVQKSAKLRAPRFSGALANSIVVFPQGNNRIIVQAGKGLPRPYDIYQELGYTPHFVSAHRPEITNWLKMKGYKQSKSGSIYVRKSKPFMLPAIVAMTPDKVNRIVDMVLKENKVIK